MTADQACKFWEVVVRGSVVATRYGKLGTAGRTTEKDGGDAAGARTLYDKLVREKCAKGYVEVAANAKDSVPSEAAKA